DEHKVCPELSLQPTPGHTHHHVSVWIESQGKRTVVTGNMMHNPLQFDLPERTVRFDMDQETGCRTRQSFVAQVANTDALVIGSHFSDPSSGWVVRDEDGCRLAQNPAHQQK